MLGGVITTRLEFQVGKSIISFVVVFVVNHMSFRDQLAGLLPPHEMVFVDIPSRASIGSTRIVPGSFHEFIGTISHEWMLTHAIPWSLTSESNRLP